jgi:integrase/recombinase XerD
MPSYKIELNNKSNKDSNEHKLMLRITVDRKHSRIALDYSVLESHFIQNPKQSNKYIRHGNAKHQTINDHIGKKIQQAIDAAESLEKEGKQITAKAIKQRMLRPKSSSFSHFLSDQIKNLLRSNNIGNYKKHKVIEKVLKEYVNEEDIAFQEIDVKFLNEFQSYLKVNGRNQTTIHGYLKIIRAIFYKAIEYGLITQFQNPFLSFRLKLGKPDRSKLTEDEIKIIEELKLPEGDLIWHVRNTFMFAFYTAGIRISDLLMLKWSNILNGRLIYQMHKTGKVHSLKITDQAKKILNYYGPKEVDEYIFPFFRSDIDYTNPMFLHNQISAKTALINKYLKFIAEKAGINKNISTHTARHSFADIARKKTNNIYNLSKTLGHSDLKITEAYLASFDEDAVDSTLDDVFNKTI